jgi:integrase
MNRGQGRVFARVGSPYWWVSYYAHGKEQREAARHVRTDEKLEAIEKHKHEAERFLKRRLGEIAAEKHGGRAFLGPQAERVTVGEILDSLECDYKLRDKWNSKNASNLKPIREHFGTWYAVDVTTDAIGKCIEELRGQGYSNATVNRRTQLLGQAFKVGMRNKQVSTIPFIPRLSEIGNERQGFFETADFETVVAKLPEYLQDFAHYGFLTGWRKGSIASLRWPDVGDDVIYLRAKNAKTRKPGSIPVVGEVAAIIERRRAARVFEKKDKKMKFSEFVFHCDGAPVGDFRKAWATACVAAGMGHMVCPKCGTESADKTCEPCRVGTKYSGKIFHDFRRTASRNMIAAGVPQAVAMKITGHRTDSMFRRYAIVSEEQKREALVKTQEHVAASAARKKVATMGQK